MAPRITSSLWISAFVRRVSLQGDYCTVVQKGAEAAGAIFVVHRNPATTTCSLYGPAPQTVLADEGGAGRLFEQVLDQATVAEIDTYLDRQRNFDPDIWIVELESRGDQPDFGDKF